MQSKKQYVKIIFQSPFLFFNPLFKKTLIPSSVKRANPFVLNKKGFTVIGVLVASAIGLIVVGGLSQMFSNIHTQLGQMEQKSQKIFLNDLIGSELKTGCTNTLKPHGNSIIDGINVDSFSELKDETDRVILDLDPLKGHNYFQLRCSDDTDPTDPDPCKCDGKSSPCNRKWTLSFISQSELNGLPVYNKNFSVDLAVKYTSTGPPPLNLSRDGKDGLSCNISNISLATPPPESLDCIQTDKTKNLALIGCGTTTGITEPTTTAYGYNASSSSSTGLDNTFFGYEAGKNNSSGKSNTFIGYNAGFSNSIGYWNTFVGYMAGARQSHFAGHENTFIGSKAGINNSSGSKNAFIGSEAGENNSTGYYNTFIGSKAGKNNSTSSRNIFIGYQAGENNTGDDNAFIGSGAGYYNTSGKWNTFVGFEAGKNNSTGQQNTFIGYKAGSSNSTGRYNTFIGYNAGSSNSSGHYNAFIGHNAGFSNSTGHYSTFIGFEAGKNNSAGKENVFIGHKVGLNNSSGKWNTFLGFEAGKNNSTSDGNTFIGRQAGLINGIGYNNTFIGAEVGKNNIIGNMNTFVGYRAGWKSVKDRNTFVGYNAGENNSTGEGNTFVGNSAGAQITTGSGNIFIGFHAGDNPSYVGTRNQLVIGNDSHREWIKGTIGTSTLSVNGVSIPLSSSRALKKNIRPDRNFNKALEDILKTPLFTYEYKNKQDHPEKSRMGIISEELPKHLRFKDNSNLPHPDWPSIYGTFWAGIKALHEMIVDLKQDISSKQKALVSRWEQLNRRQELFENKLSQLNGELTAEIKPSTKIFAQSLKHFKEKVFLKFKTMDQAFQAFKEELSLKLKALASHIENLRKQLEKLIQEFSQFRTEWADLKKHFESANKNLAGKTENFSKELARVKTQISESNKQLKQDSQNLAEAKKALERDHKEIQALKEQLQSLIKNSK